MYTECQKYLSGKLKAAGIHSQIITSMKKLQLYQDAHVGAVLFETETFTRSNLKKTYTDEKGDDRKRHKILLRETTFSVIIGDAVPENTERIFEAFLVAIETGLYINGNYTLIEVLDAEWVDDDDSILKSKVAVNVKVKFTGGVYKDILLAKLSGIEVVEIGKET